MRPNDPTGDPQQMRQFLNFVLETGRMNAASVDTDLRHTWVHNSSPEPPDEEILGKTDAELFSEEMAEPTTTIKREAIETESRVEREFTFVKPWGQQRYRAAAEPIRGADGSVEGAAFAATDVSDGYRLLERTTDAVYTVDTDWEVTFWNEKMTERTGREAEAVLGRNLWEVFGDSIPDELEERYRAVMASGEPAEFEQYLPEPFDYWVEIRVFADDHGLSVYSRNVTERKEYEERLKTQRDTLDVLNRVLSHDVRNDLQLVTAYAELISDRLDEEGRTYVETISESAAHAVELTKTASEISNILFAENGRPKRTPLGTVLETEIESIRTAHPDAVVLVDGEIRDASVAADEMLGSVFRNLLKNAVQHNDKQVPEVTVSTGARAEAVTVRVADNGPGIPDAQKDAVFGKGEKGLDSRGTGIGLYLVSLLVDRYGGEVDVSDNEPEGAVFSVTLPTVEADREGGDGR
jgi:PAS domain S-box-containing protein